MSVLGDGVQPERMHIGRGRGEDDRQSPLTGGEPLTRGDRGLAGAALPDGDDVLSAVDVLTAGQRHDWALVHRRDGQEVEGVAALGGREGAALILRSNTR